MLPDTFFLATQMPSQQTVVAIPPGGTPIQIAQADPTRWYIEFANPNSGNIFVASFSGLTLQTGYNMNALLFLPFKFVDCGSLVTGPWFGLNDPGIIGVDGTILVTEVFVRKTAKLTDLQKQTRGG